MEHLKVKVNGIDLHVLDYGGSGQVVICAHGLMANSRCWDGVASMLSDEYRVIAFDLRGRGDSAKPASGYSLMQHVDDVRGLLEYFEVKQAVFLGHSLGSNIGVCFAAKYPRMLSHLILVDAGADVDPRIGQYILPLVDMLEQVYPDFETYVTQYRSSSLFPAWNWCLSNYFFHNVHHQGDGSVRTKTTKAVIMDEMQNNLGISVNQFHPEIKSPTLIVQAPLGFGDPELPVITREKAGEMAAMIEGGQFIVMDGTNHFTVVLNEYERLAAEIKNYLKAN